MQTVRSIYKFHFNSLSRLSLFNFVFEKMFSIPKN
jgi:hypothetical protein